MSRDADKYKYRKKGDINRRNKKIEKKEEKEEDEQMEKDLE